MKKIFFSTLLILLSVFSKSQTCEGYFPMKAGAVMEIHVYNEKGKLQSINKVSIIDVLKKGDGTVISVNSVITDEKGKQIATSDYEANCDSGAFFISMKSLITADQMKAWKDMTLSIDADDIDYPVDFFENQKLNDAHLKVNVSMNDMSLPGMTIDITDRVIKGKETITTPAGTFECIKITSRQKIKNIISYEVNVVEWVSKGNGIVRTETYKTDKLKGYSELAKLEK